MQEFTGRDTHFIYWFVGEWALELSGLFNFHGWRYHECSRTNLVVVFYAVFLLQVI